MIGRQKTRLATNLTTFSWVTGDFWRLWREKHISFLHFFPPHFRPSCSQSWRRRPAHRVQYCESRMRNVLVCHITIKCTRSVMQIWWWRHLGSKLTFFFFFSEFYLKVLYCRGEIQLSWLSSYIFKLGQQHICFCFYVFINTTNNCYFYQ